MLFWLFLFFPFCLQAQRLLKAGVYHDLKPKEALVLDTGTFTFIGLEMKGLGKELWLDARKAKSLTLFRCRFEGNEKVTGLLSSGELLVNQCTFKGLKTGIHQQSPAGTIQKVMLVQNKFEDNETSIALNRGSGNKKVSFDFTLKNNWFLHEIKSGIARKGLVVGPEVVILQADPAMPTGFRFHQIGGEGSQNSGLPFPNANIWPTLQTDRSVAPVHPITVQPIDIQNDPNGWQDPPNWTAIENLSGTNITYFRYKNEFVKNNASGLQNIVIDGPLVRAGTNTPGFIPNPAFEYEYPCDAPIDPWPVIVFPARIAVVSGLDGVEKANETLVLGDAIPNPAHTESRITFSLPEGTEQAVLQILELGTGRVLQNIEVKERGKGEVILNLANAPSAVYSYRMLVNGVPTKAKKLVVSH